MGMKVEKRLGQQELADFLADLSRQGQGGQLKGETSVMKVPEAGEGTIHLKEEEGEVVTTIKLRWLARDAMLTDMLATRAMLREKVDPWSVNAEGEYIEEKRAED